MDGNTLFVLIATFALATIGTALVLRRKSGKKIATKRGAFFDQSEQIAEGQDQPEKPIPTYAYWTDGPNGRSRVREGVVVRKKGKRLFIQPQDAPNSVVRRRISVLHRVVYN